VTGYGPKEEQMEGEEKVVNVDQGYVSDERVIMIGEMLAVSPVVMSTEVNELFDALAKAQAEFPPIPRDKVATIKGVSRATNKEYSYDFNYADLSSIIGATTPIAAKHGLTAISFPVNSPANGRPGVVHLVGHKSGQFIAGVFYITSAKAQDDGILLTYTRRYQSQAAWGVVGEEDPDGDKRPPIDKQKEHKQHAAAPTAQRAVSATPVAEPANKDVPSEADEQPDGERDPNDTLNAHEIADVIALVEFSHARFKSVLDFFKVDKVEQLQVRDLPKLRSGLAKARAAWIEKHPEDATEEEGSGEKA
jgi:hypothetical protein